MEGRQPKTNNRASSKYAEEEKRRGGREREGQAACDRAHPSKIKQERLVYGRSPGKQGS